MLDIKSSYNNNYYEEFFKNLNLILNPKKIIEFGILNGYSLLQFAKYTSKNCKIKAYDLFDRYPFNAANYKIINNKFTKYKKVKIIKGDYYKVFRKIKNNTVDIIHIDISNCVQVYEFAIVNYLKKIKKNGLMILEGGSKKRDNVTWMKKYKKIKIQKILKKYSNNIYYKTIEYFPSVTIIKKK